jgi:hypothetical protein
MRPVSRLSLDALGTLLESELDRLKVAVVDRCLPFHAAHETVMARAEIVELAESRMICSGSERRDQVASLSDSSVIPHCGVG